MRSVRKEARRKMNELNYGSLEACKRLVDAGIVMETDVEWGLYPNGDWALHKRGISTLKDIPAPSMAEIWRELPDEVNGYTLDVTRIGKDTQATYSKIDIFDTYCTIGSGESENPTDALIDLRIWLEREKGENK
jgi:hypothetical protein